MLIPDNAIYSAVQFATQIATSVVKSSDLFSTYTLEHVLATLRPYLITENLDYIVTENGDRLVA